MASYVPAPAVASADATSVAHIVNGVGVPVVARRIVWLRQDRAGPSEMIALARRVAIIRSVACHARAEVLARALSMSVALVVHCVVVSIVTLRSHGGERITAGARGGVTRAHFVARSL